MKQNYKIDWPFIAFWVAALVFCLLFWIGAISGLAALVKYLTNE